MDAAALVKRLMDMGLALSVKGGQVHGRMRDGGRIPYEAWTYIDEVKDRNAEVAAYLLGQPREVRARWSAPGVAREVASAIEAGGVELVGKVRYHQRSGECEAQLRVLSPGGEQLRIDGLEVDE